MQRLDIKSNQTSAIFNNEYPIINNFSYVCMRIKLYKPTQYRHYD